MSHPTTGQPPQLHSLLMSSSAADLLSLHRVFADNISALQTVLAADELPAQRKAYARWLMSMPKPSRRIQSARFSVPAVQDRLHEAIAILGLIEGRAKLFPPFVGMFSSH